MTKICVGRTSRRKIILSGQYFAALQAHTVRVIVRYAEVLGEVFGRSAAPGAGRELFVANHNPNRRLESWSGTPAQHNALATQCGRFYCPQLQNAAFRPCSRFSYFSRQRYKLGELKSPLSFAKDQRLAHFSLFHSISSLD